MSETPEQRATEWCHNPHYSLADLIRDAEQRGRSEGFKAGQERMRESIKAEARRQAAVESEEAKTTSGACREKHLYGVDCFTDFEKDIDALPIEEPRP